MDIKGIMQTRRVIFISTGSNIVLLIIIIIIIVSSHVLLLFHEASSAKGTRYDTHSQSVVAEGPDREEG